MQLIRCFLWSSPSFLSNLNDMMRFAASRLFFAFIQKTIAILALVAKEKERTICIFVKMEESKSRRDGDKTSRKKACSMSLVGN